MRKQGFIAWLSTALLATLVSLPRVAAAELDTSAMAQPDCAVELLVLGIAQDAGIPQIGRSNDRAWADGSELQPAFARLATSLALIDHRHQKRYLFEATPDIRQQLQRLDRHASSASAGLGIDGIFLSHAHIGHYAGLMFLGHESAGAQSVPVYAMPRMREYLSSNGPWDQMVRFNNIVLRALDDRVPVPLTDGLSVTPLRVPHRDEYSETVGFSIAGPTASAVFIPDIDSWQRWEDEFGQRIEDVIARHDVAFLDATFYDNNELPGRDMTKFPHPRIAQMMARFDALAAQERSRIRFIHLNHSNPARFDDSPAGITIRQRGYRVAREGETVCLGNAEPSSVGASEVSAVKRD